VFQGTYVFKLTVTDTSGATATDDVTVTVNAVAVSPNQPPVANAGPGQTIALSSNSAKLYGTLLMILMELFPVTIGSK